MAAGQPDLPAPAVMRATMRNRVTLVNGFILVCLWLLNGFVVVHGWNLVAHLTPTGTFPNCTEQLPCSTPQAAMLPTICASLAGDPFFDPPPACVAYAGLPIPENVTMSLAPGTYEWNRTSGFLHSFYQLHNGTFRVQGKAGRVVIRCVDHRFRFAFLGHRAVLSNLVFQGCYGLIDASLTSVSITDVSLEGGGRLATIYIKPDSPNGPFSATFSRVLMSGQGSEVSDSLLSVTYDGASDGTSTCQVDGLAIENVQSTASAIVLDCAVTATRISITNSQFFNLLRLPGPSASLSNMHVRDTSLISINPSVYCSSFSLRDSSFTRVGCAPQYCVEYDAEFPTVLSLGTSVVSCDIHNTTFEHNTVPLLIASADTRLSNNVFRNNSVPGVGLGIQSPVTLQAVAGRTVELVANMWEDNRILDTHCDTGNVYSCAGGALALYGSGSFFLSHEDFRGNQCPVDGAHLAVFSGSVYINSSRFYEQPQGGYIDRGGAGVLVAGTASVTFQSCVMPQGTGASSSTALRCLSDRSASLSLINTTVAAGEVACCKDCTCVADTGPAAIDGVCPTPAPTPAPVDQDAQWGEAYHLYELLHLIMFGGIPWYWYKRKPGWLQRLSLAETQGEHWLEIDVFIFLGYDTSNFLYTSQVIMTRLMYVAILYIEGHIPVFVLVLGCLAVFASFFRFSIKLENSTLFRGMRGVCEAVVLAFNVALYLEADYLTFVLPLVLQLLALLKGLLTSTGTQVHYIQSREAIGFFPKGTKPTSVSLTPSPAPYENMQE